MAQSPRILAFAGSARRGSWNKKVLPIAVAGARDAGAEVTVLDFADLELPLYNADLEEEKGLPENAKKLKAMLREHQGVLIASPEYNSSITPLLKNAIDWSSRPETKDEGSLIAWRDKVAGLVSASPGALGGLRALRHVREILSNIGVLVIPQQHSVVKAHEAFDAAGNLLDAKAAQTVRGVGAKLAETLARLAPR